LVNLHRAEVCTYPDVHQGDRAVDADLPPRGIFELPERRSVPEDDDEVLFLNADGGPRSASETGPKRLVNEARCVRSAAPIRPAPTPARGSRPTSARTPSRKT
jgi:hypothetical protein